MRIKLALYCTNLTVFLCLQYVKINIEDFGNINFYNIFVHTVNELLFILDCATKYSLHNPVNLFATSLIIMLTNIVSFYIFRTSSQ